MVHYKLGVLTVFLILICNLSIAQIKSFEKGYIVLQSGDTLKGWVKDRDPEPFVSLYRKIRFKEKPGSFAKKYSPYQIQGYGFNRENFISMRFRETQQFFKFRYYTDDTAPKVFLKVIRRSEHLNYYEKLFVHDDNDYLDFIPLFHRPGSDEFVRVTQGVLGFKKKRLAEYFYDYPELIRKIERENSRSPDVLGLYKFYIEEYSK